MGRLEVERYKDPWNTVLCYADDSEPAPSEPYSNQNDHVSEKTCPDFNRRNIEDLSRKEKWCPSCTDLVAAFIVTKGCRACVWSNGREHRDIKYIPSPDFDARADCGQIGERSAPRWSFDDPDVRKLNSTFATEPELTTTKTWQKISVPIDGVKLEKFGLNSKCPICWAHARKIVQNTPKLTTNGSEVELRTLNLYLPWRVYSHFDGDAPLRVEIFTYLSFIQHESETINPIRSYQSRYVLYIVPTQDGQGVDIIDGPPPDPAKIVSRLREQFIHVDELRTAVVEPMKAMTSYSIESVIRADIEFPPSFRLIDVERQCVVKIGNTHKKYSAISYRWDATDKNMLTRGTEPAFEQPGSLSLDTMSRTLFDCMTVARHLDIPYIWIDRYCIMQGDDAEKAEQIHAMGHIYSHSWLTIICAMSGKMHSGLPGWSRPFEYRSSKAFSFLGPASGWPVWRTNKGYMEPPEWLTRGWTMQEEHLSRRRIYMLNNAVVIHLSCPSVAYHDVTSGRVASGPKDCCVNVNQSLSATLEMYVGRSLAKPEDRVNAVAGLLESRGFDHVYGIGTQNLRRNICWKPVRRSSRSQSCLRFPTWSWAHFNRRVSWPSDDELASRPCCRAILGKDIVHQPRSIVKQMGLSASIVQRLDENHLVVRTKARWGRITEMFLPDNMARGTKTTNLIVCNLYLMVRKVRVYHVTTLQLVVAPFKSPFHFKHHNVTHVRRVGSRDTVKTFPKLPSLDLPLQKLAFIRPVSIQSLTNLKAFRMRHYSLIRKHYVLRKPIHIPQLQFDTALAKRRKVPKPKPLRSKKPKYRQTALIKMQQSPSSGRIGRKSKKRKNDTVSGPNGSEQRPSKRPRLAATGTKSGQLAGQHTAMAIHPGKPPSRLPKHNLAFPINEEPRTQREWRLRRKIARLRRQRPVNGAFFCRPMNAKCRPYRTFIIH